MSALDAAVPPPPAKPRRLDARSLRDLVLDPGSWKSWDTPVPARTVDDDYARDLARAAEKTGQDEAVVTGEGLLRGRRVAVVAGEFGFLAGSIGVATAQRLMAAVERATEQGLPLLAAPVSGGTRMQEGTVAFLQMIGITAAIARHKEAGLPYLVYLRSPTFGGVLASWGSLGHVTIAEPGASIGFLGPRVYESLYGEPFPPDVQTAEHLAERGLIDAVVPAEEIADVADRALRVLAARGTWHRGAQVEGPVEGDGTDADDPEDGRSAWDVVTASRRTDRPGVRRLLRTAATDVVALNGTGAGESDPGLLLALARFGGAPCVVLGQDRRGQSLSAPLGPAALREARRGMRLADELRLPLVTLIDTPGAALSVEAEEGGLAAEIARCLADLVMLQAPTLAVLLGQGTGGGALALVPADRVLAAANGWLGPLPPEGASAIVHRDTDHAGEMAAAQGVRATDLWRAGIVDRVVPERPDAADEPTEFCRRLGRVLAEELAGLLGRDDVERRRSRTQRYRHLGR
ncbi:acetyl-CoA carboxylase carboxyltransferase subunit alpha/beta [Modestobacter sp. Leaf380]|uniref:acetyl-CoA carboxylase carboxyltransferase subunit alpha/beta n=1 Tax=Modestobacter sp. Leaf380 TaxID=1736356 RepID=UPI000B2CC2A4|nr:acetyl-CoA carboxylase carboxyltransferase subunit alpha/beta [Modestobacter sp. Leaf380]